MASYSIRVANTDDIPNLVNIAVSAVAKFATIPELAHLAGGERSYMIIKIQQSLEQGRIFLAEHDQIPVGFLGAFQKDTALYVAEISVSNEYNGKGIGSLLLEAVFQWARERALANKEDEARVSLTAYEEVPWNGPWYLKRGFKVVDAELIGPEHVEKMRYDREVRKLNLPGFTRRCMLWQERVQVA